MVTVSQDDSGVLLVVFRAMDWVTIWVVDWVADWVVNWVLDWV